MRLIVIALAVAIAFVGPGNAQTTDTGDDLSTELRDLLERLESGERLTPPVSQDRSAQSAAEIEPNDSIGASTLVAIDGTLTGSIGKRGDSDWWRVRAPRRGALTVASQTVPTALDLTVRLWNADRQPITNWVGAAAPGGVLSAVFDLPGGGEFVLELRDGRDDAESPDPYEISLGFVLVPELTEPNDSFGAAMEVPIDTAVTASILPAGDSDWIAVMADDQGELGVRVDAPPENLDLAVRIWSADGQPLSGWSSVLAVGGPLDARFDLPRPGRYVLELRDGSNDQRSATPFEIALAFVPTGDGGEPNDTAGTATPLAFEAPTQATILPAGDVDWYVIDAPEQGALDVALTESPAELDLTFRVWNRDNQPVTGWFAPLAKGGDAAGVVDLQEPGRYSIEVRDGNNDARSTNPYRILTTLSPTGDRFEPNNSFGAAAPVRLGESYIAAIFPVGDSDWYTVDLPGQGALTVALTQSPRELDLSFRIWNADIQTITGWIAPLAKGGDNVNVVELARPGRYVVELRDGRDDGRDAAPYHLRLDLAPSNDAFEPNDSVARARPLGLGETIEATVLPKNDADWYRVDVGMPGKLVVAVHRSPAGMDIAVRVWNSDMQPITGWFTPTAAGGPVAGEAEMKTPGSYYVEVRDGSNDASSVEPYALRVDARVP